MRRVHNKMTQRNHVRLTRASFSLSHHSYVAVSGKKGLSTSSYKFPKGWLWLVWMSFPYILFGLGKTDPFFFASCLAKKRGGPFLQHNICHPPIVLWGLLSGKKTLAWLVFLLMHFPASPPPPPPPPPIPFFFLLF